MRREGKKRKERVTGQTASKAWASYSQCLMGRGRAGWVLRSEHGRRRGWTMEMRRETLWRNFKSGGVLCVTCVVGALATWRIVNSREGSAVSCRSYRQRMRAETESVCTLDSTRLKRGG